LWITQVVQHLLRADTILGLDVQTYERVMAAYQP
jgi:hypothetical protein